METSTKSKIIDLDELNVVVDNFLVTNHLWSQIYI